jgi:hypothetical protein
MERLIRTEKSCHWYTKSGEPAFEMPKKDGSGMRSTNVKDARELDLVPSVSTVLGILDKPQLNDWKQEQAILASLTLPRLEGEGEDAFAKRVVQDAKSVSRDAMDLGTRVHKVLEFFIENDICEDICEDKEAYKYAEPAIKWLAEVVDFEKPCLPEVRLFHKELGFAGTTDLLCTLKDGRTCIIDFKTQGTKEKYGHKITFYEEWLFQVSAYGMASSDMGKPVDCLINLGISTGLAGVCYHKEWSSTDRKFGEGFFLRSLELFRYWKKL